MSAAHRRAEAMAAHPSTWRREPGQDYGRRAVELSDADLEAARAGCDPDDDEIVSASVARFLAAAPPAPIGPPPDHFPLCVPCLRDLNQRVYAVAILAGTTCCARCVTATRGDVIE